MAPLDYMGRYMKDFFDYAIADELHQLAGDTAQGNGLAVLERIAKRLVGLTGTMMGGYADDLYNILYRMDAPQMAKDGYAWGGEGRSVFQGNYGVCEEIVKRFTSDNACSRASKAQCHDQAQAGLQSTAFRQILDGEYRLRFFGGHRSGPAFLYGVGNSCCHGRGVVEGLHGHSGSDQKSA